MQTTQLAHGKITNADTLTIELVEPPDMPPPTGPTPWHMPFALDLPVVDVESHAAESPLMI